MQVPAQSYIMMDCPHVTREKAHKSRVTQRRCDLEWKVARRFLLGGAAQDALLASASWWEKPVDARFSET